MASKKQFELEAEVRHDVGKGASRRLRRADKLPAIIYGGGKATQALTLEHKTMNRALEQEAFYSHILTLKVGQETDKVILKDVHRHPYKARILHMDFQRVRADEKLHMHIPLHFVGADKTPGVKAGGVISHLMSDVEVSCLPDDLPEYLELDLSNLELNQLLHLSDIPLPKGVEIVGLAHGRNTAVVSVQIPRIIEEEPVPTTEEATAPSEVPAIAQKGEGEEPKEE